jgi:hypothetical protein
MLVNKMINWELFEDDFQFLVIANMVIKATKLTTATFNLSFVKCQSKRRSNGQKIMIIV